MGKKYYYVQYCLRDNSKMMCSHIDPDYLEFTKHLKMLLDDPNVYDIRVNTVIR